MIEKLVAGIRELRTGVITGYMILFSLFLILNKIALSSLYPTFSLLLIYDLIGNIGLIIILSVLAYLIGVSFLYWLETIVNKLHIWAINKEINNKRSRIVKYYHESINPLSLNARNRLVSKLNEFFYLYKTEQSQIKDIFISINLKDVLWMDGRLEENKISSEYISLNTEAFFRMGIGFLIPLVVFALILELSFHPLELVLLSIISLFFSHWLILQGFYLHKKSISMLAHHIADGKFLSPSMANFKKEYESVK